MADDQTLPFVIEQATGTNPIKVTLGDHDAPFGSPRKGGMFELGGRNETVKVRLDGRQTPIIHTKYTVWAPSIIKGHLRDHFTGVDGHGQDIVAKLQDILDAQQPVKLTCGPWTWSAFPDDFKLPVEGLNDFTYELHFEVLSRPGYKPPVFDDQYILPYPTDLTAEVQQQLAEQRAKLVTAIIAADVQIALATMFEALDQTLSDAVSAATTFENADLPAIAEAVAMGSAAESVRSAVEDIQAELAGLDPDTALTSSGQENAASFQAQQFATLALLDDCRSRMWSVQYTANKRVRSVSQLYKVIKGDTLDSIAQKKLGTGARAPDLKLRQEDLVPGRLIRIPKQ